VNSMEVRMGNVTGDDDVITGRTVRLEVPGGGVTSVDNIIDSLNKASDDSLSSLDFFISSC